MEQGQNYDERWCNAILFSRMATICTNHCTSAQNTQRKVALFSIVFNCMVVKGTVQNNSTAMSLFRNHDEVTEANHITVQKEVCIYFKKLANQAK